MGVFGNENSYADWTGTGGATGSILCKYPLAVNVSATNISSYLQGDGGAVNMKAGIFEEVGGEPEHLIVQSGLVSVNDAGWYDFAIAETALVVDDYYLGIKIFTGQMTYAAGAAGQTAYHSADGAADFPDPYGAHSNAGLQMSIHCDYHVEGSKKGSSLPNTMTTMLNSKILFNACNRFPKLNPRQF